LNSELFALFALIHRLAPTAMMDRLRLEDHPSHLETQAICAMLVNFSSLYFSTMESTARQM